MSRRSLTALALASTLLLGSGLAACGSDGEEANTTTTTAAPATSTTEEPVTSTTAPAPSTTEPPTTTERRPSTTTRPAPTTPSTLPPPVTTEPDAIGRNIDPEPGSEDFCTAFDRFGAVASRDDEGGDPVAAFKAIYGEMRASFDQLASATPAELRAEVDLLRGWLRDNQAKVDAVRTEQDIDALEDSASDDRYEDAFERISDHADEVCYPDDGEPGEDQPAD